jgi:hypothetical protein
MYVHAQTQTQTDRHTHTHTHTHTHNDHSLNLNDEQGEQLRALIALLTPTGIVRPPQPLSPRDALPDPPVATINGCGGVGDSKAGQDTRALSTANKRAYRGGAGGWGQTLDVSSIVPSVQEVALVPLACSSEVMVVSVCGVCVCVCVCVCVVRPGCVHAECSKRFSSWTMPAHVRTRPSAKLGPNACP